MPGVKCTKCGHVINRTQAITQIGIKTLQAISGISMATVGAQATMTDSILAGIAIETGVTCPKCGGKNCFEPN